tara:strand:- start:3510 stop:3707 length:198 start_codon:yes stop_codon:yes gene_type:complete
MKNKKEINEEFWNTLDGWLSEGADKESLSELFLSVGILLQQNLNGKKRCKEVTLKYVEAISDSTI